MVKNKPQHLLVIRLSAMGDVAMTVPVLLALTKEYPELKITFLTKAFFKPVLEDIPNVKVFVADVKGSHKGVNGLWKLYKELRKLNIDAVADLHNVLRSNILKMFFRFGGTPFVQLDKGRAEKKALVAEKDKKFEPLMPMHDRYVSVFKKLDLEFELDKNCIRKPRSLTEDIKAKLGLKPIKTIGIAPFAAFEGKVYPLPLMEKVVSELNALAKCQILLFGGGKKEAEILEGWEHTYENCVSVIGKLSFKEELNLIGNLDVMISMDSGNGHLAAMYGVPVITLWGVTHPYAGFYPFGQDESNALLADRTRFPLIPTSVYGNKFPPGYEKAMETIPAEKVVHKVQEVIGG
ncbi:glycosyltransferase family 9 protein [Maribacter thermophilus]|uniref:glycosyltransferase family 9 protein n=1 Tax=Maribacter thermophilus TaxID=1197874 RepID=UPI000AB9703D|nr:glycosyltransferase family 9 protein [Maribacter thermophilus]